jgi:hypothetical protein
VAADAVRDGEHVIAGQPDVLVVGPGAADGHDGGSEDEAFWHAASPRRFHDRAAA